MKVSELAAQGVAITVKLRGFEFTYRPLPSAVSSEIDAAFAGERPTVPLKPHPMAGSADYSKYQRDPYDADYSVKADRYASRVSAAKLAVSFGIESDDGRTYETVPEPHRSAWLKEVATKMCAAISDEEIGGVIDRITKAVRAVSTDVAGN